MATRMYVCESVEHPSSLLMGLNEQRLQGQLCDVTVRVQGHLFKAHTNILASAMGYFRDLFLNPTKQVKKEIIEIPMIVNSIGFAKVLDFIYTSQLCLSQSSVMQVLCSACYLQIPYVVDKCQEFIVTHGHTSPQNTFPSLTDQRYLSNKPTDSQECELINTPPSPGNQSSSTGNRDDQNGASGSPLVEAEGPESPERNNGKSDNMILIKQENSDGNSASRALMEFSQQNRISSELNLQKAGTLKMLLQNGEENTGTDIDTIDHGSLAEYFSRGSALNLSEGSLPPTSAPLTFRNSPTNSPTTAVENHLYSMTKNMSKDAITPSSTSSVSQYLLSMKKEKPKKEYRCEYCSKLFGRQQHLKRHILTHTGERPYPCHLCEKRFRRSEHLKHHIVKHQQQELLAGNSDNPAFVNFASSGRKRPRKPVPSDAYGMSKMMLVSYNQPNEANTENKKVEQDTLGRNLIFLNKMNSSVDNISERLAIAASQSLATGGDDESQNEQLLQVYNSEEASPSPVALNLSNRETTTTIVESVIVKEEMAPSPAIIEVAIGNLDGSPAQQSEGSPQNGLDMSVCSSVPTNGEEIKDLDMNNSINGELSNSEDSKPSPLTNGQNGHNGDINASSDMTIDGFASSEVVTNDLKRLFAAMDE